MSQNTVLLDNFLKYQPGSLVKIVTKNSESPYFNKTAIVVAVSVENDIAILSMVDTEENLVFNISNIDNNSYEIIGLTDVLSDNLTISDEITLDENIVAGVEETVRELGIWEKNYSHEEIKESLLDTLIQYHGTKKTLNNTIHSQLNRKAENILKLIKNITISDKKFITKDDNYRPQINKILNNDYSHSLIKPIVFDKKKIYTEDPNLLKQSQGLQDDDIVKIPNVEFTDFNEEMDFIENLNNQYRMLRKNDISDIADANIIESTRDGTITRDQLRNKLVNDNRDVIEVANEEEEPVRVSGRSVNKPFVNTSEGINSKYYRIPEISSATEVYRVCNPLDKCYSMKIVGENENFSNIPSVKLEKRFAESANYKICDRLDDVFISDRKYNRSKTTVCTGSGGESEYSGTLDKKLHSQTDYNRCISKPPILKKLVSGEKLFVVGLYLKSINVDNTSISQSNYSNSASLITFPKTNDTGLSILDHVVMDQISTSTHFEPEQCVVHQDINDIVFDELDMTKNNFILFGESEQEISQELYNSYLKKLVPTIEDIFKIESKNLEKCDNFTDINRVLSKYQLDFDDINSGLARKIGIKKLLNMRRNKYLKYSKLNKLRAKKSQHNIAKFSKLNMDITNIINMIDKKNRFNFTSRSKDEYISKLLNDSYEKLRDVITKSYTINELEDYLITHKRVLFRYPADISDTVKILSLTKLIVKASLNEYLYSLDYYKNSLFFEIINSKSDTIFNEIINLYGIKLFEQNTINIDGLIDKNMLNYIDLIEKLNNSLDGGKLFENALQCSNLEIKLKDVTDEYSKVIGEQDFRDVMAQIENEFDELKLSIENQKKMYNVYMNECNGFKVVKIYGSKKDLVFDNYSGDIFFDSNFDTVSNDIKIAQSVSQDNVSNQLKKYYPLDSDESILDKRTAVVENDVVEHPRTKIKDGQYALLLDMGFRLELGQTIHYNEEEYVVCDVNYDGSYNLKNKFTSEIIFNVKSKHIENYSSITRSSKIGGKFLYKRHNNKWVAQSQQDILNSNLCLTENNDVKYLLEINFDNLLERIVDSDNVKCTLVDMENLIGRNEKNCVPKVFLPTLNLIEQNRKNFINVANIRDSMNSLKISLDESRKSLQIGLENLRYLKLLNKNKSNTSEINVEDSSKSKIPRKLKIGWRNVLSIEDPDERLTQIKLFIEENGRFVRSYSDNNIYWNYPDTNEVLCCKHYLDLVDMAYKSNDIRTKIIENILIKWNYNSRGESIIDGSRYICQCCGQELDQIKYSIHEGFGVEDRPISLREVVSTIEEEDNEFYFTQEQENIHKLLTLYANKMGINLTNSDIEYVVKNSEKELSNQITLHDYYYTENVNVLKERKSYKKTAEKIAIGEAMYFQQFEKLTIENLNTFLTENSDESAIAFSKFIRNRKGPRRQDSPHSVYIYHKMFLECRKLCVLLSYLIVVIRTAIKEYKIKGQGDERTAKLKSAFIGNFINNDEELISFLIDNITVSLIKTGQVSDFINWNFIVPISNLKAKEYFMQTYFLPIYENILQEFTVKTRFDVKNEMMLTTLNNSQFREDANKLWKEFKPSLEVNYELEVDIEYEIDIHNYNQNRSALGNLNKLDPNYNENFSILIERDTLYQLKLKNNLRKLGNLLISKVNTIIKKDLTQKYIAGKINLISYTSSCCENLINNKFFEYFSEKDPLINDILMKIKNINDILDDSSSNLKKNAIMFLNKTKVRGERSGRELMDYMYIDEEAMSPNEYRKYLENQYRQINNIIITERFKITDESIGKRRIFVEITDEDVNELHTLLESYEDRIDITEYLKEKFLDSYSDLSDEDINSKIDIILNHNGIVHIDRVSGQFKHIINDEINNYLSNTETEELKNELEILNRATKIKNTLHLSENKLKHSVSDENRYNELLKNDIKLINELSKLFNRLDLVEQNIYANGSLAILNSINEFYKTNRGNRISEKNRREIVNNKIVKFHNEIFGMDIQNEKLSSISQFTNKLTNGDLSHILDNLGNYESIMEMGLAKIDSRLIIEDFKGENKKDEGMFRKRELHKNTKIYSQIFNINMYARYFLTVISALFNKITRRGNNYLEIYSKHDVKYKNKNIIALDKDKNKFNKLPYWLDYNDKPRDSNCYCPLEKPYLFTGETKDEFRALFDENFTPLDAIINDITSKFAEETIDRTLFLSNLSDMYDKIEIYHQIIDLLRVLPIRYDCNNRIKFIGFFEINSVLTLSSFILNDIVTSFITKFKDEFEEFALQIIDNFIKISTNDNIFGSINDNHVVNIINNYKTSENRRRKNAHDKLGKDLQAVKSLYRKLNIGNMSGTQDMMEFDNEEIFHDNGVDSNLDEQVRLNNAIAQYGDSAEDVLEQERIDNYIDNNETGLGVGTLWDDNQNYGEEETM